MSNEVKITITADGSGLKIVTDDGQAQFVNLGKKAKEAGDQASAGIDSVIQKMDQLKSTAVTVAQTLAGVFVADKIAGMVKEMALLNARYETLGVAMKVVGQNAGYTGAQMDLAATGMQSMGISMVESRQQAMRLVQAHIDLANAQKLARIAQDAAVIGNMNSSEAFANMIHGISTGQTDVLRTIGLNVSMEQSYKAMADTLHKHQDELTQNERTQGVLNSVMKAGADIAGTYEAAMDTAGKQINSMKRYTEDLKTIQGEVFNEILTVAVMAYTSHLKESNAEMRALAANGELKAWGMELAQIFVSVANAIDNMLTGVKMAGTWLAQRNVAGDITAKYQDKLDALGNTPDVWKQRGELVAQRDAEIKASLALLDEANVELGKRADRFQNAFDARQKAIADAAAKEAAAVADKLKQTQDAMVNYTQMLEAGQITQAQYLKGVSLIQQAMNGDNHKFGDTTPAAKPHAASEYERLIASIKEKIAVEQLDLETQDKLTAGEKFRVETYAKIDAGLMKLTLAEKLEIDGKFEKLILIEKEKAIEDAATKQMLANMTARSDARKKENDAINAYFEAQTEGYNRAVKGSQDALKAAQDQYDQYGKSKSQIAEITLLTLQSAQAKVREGSEGYEALQKQIDNQKKLIGVLKDTEALDAQKSMWVSIEGAAHTTYTNIVQGGDDVAAKVRKSLQAGIFDWLYQMTLKRWLFNISVAYSGNGVANAAMPGMGGAIGQASGLSNMVSGIGSATGLTAAGGAFSSGMSLGAAGFAPGLEMMQSATGVSSFMAGAGQAAGSAFAAAGPYVLAALAVKSLTDYHITPTGNALTATLSSTGIPSGAVGTRADFDQTSSGFLSGGNTHNATWGVADSGTTSYIDGMAKAATASAKAYAAALGLNAAAVDGFTKSIEISTTGLDAAGTKAAIDKAIGSFVDDMVSSAYGGALSALAKTGETSSATLQRVAADLTGVNAVLAQFGHGLLGISIDGATAAESLITLMGGVQNMQTQMASYYGNFYTADEQRSNTIKQINSALDGTGFDAATGTRESFRKLVESQDLTTESGRKTYAALMSVQGAFASITPVVDSVGAAAKKASDELATIGRVLSGLADTRFDLENQVLTLQGNDGEVAKRTRAADLKKLTNGITDQSAIDQITSDYDYNTSLKAQIKTLTDAKAAGENAARAQQQAADAAAAAAAQAKAAWQSVTDSIFGEVQRIRGLVNQGTAASYAQSEANLSTAAAQARAGDQAAGNALPRLSQAFLTMAEANAGSREELDYIRGRTAALLEGIGNQNVSQYGLTVPKLATGTNYVPQDGLFYLHQGEEVTPRAWNPAAAGYGVGGVSDTRLAALLARLVDEAVASREQNSKENLALLRSANRSADFLEGTNQVGVLTRTS